MFLSLILKTKKLEERRDSIEATSTDSLKKIAQKDLFQITKLDFGYQLSVFVILDTEILNWKTLRIDFTHLKKQINALCILNVKKRIQK